MSKARALPPSAIVTAAHADLKRCEYNLEQASAHVGGRFEQYCFHREHVRKAGSAQELLELALKGRELGEASGKPTTRMVYGDEELLQAALEASRRA